MNAGAAVSLFSRSFSFPPFFHFRSSCFVSLPFFRRSAFSPPSLPPMCLNTLSLPPHLFFFITLSSRPLSSSSPPTVTFLPLSSPPFLLFKFPFFSSLFSRRHPFTRFSLSFLHTCPLLSSLHPPLQRRSVHCASFFSSTFLPQLPSSSSSSPLPCFTRLSLLSPRVVNQRVHLLFFFSFSTFFAPSFRGRLFDAAASPSSPLLRPLLSLLLFILPPFLFLFAFPLPSLLLLTSSLSPPSLPPFLPLPLQGHFYYKG